MACQARSWRSPAHTAVRRRGQGPRPSRRPACRAGRRSAALDGRARGWARARRAPPRGLLHRPRCGPRRGPGPESRAAEARAARMWHGHRHAGPAAPGGPASQQRQTPRGVRRQARSPTRRLAKRPPSPRQQMHSRPDDARASPHAVARPQDLQAPSRRDPWRARRVARPRRAAHPAVAHGAG